MLRRAGVALALVVVAFAYLCFTVLAPWQLGKNTKTSRENHQIQGLAERRPGAGDFVAAQQDSSAPGAQWRRVTATGITCRCRRCSPGPGHRGAPAYEVLAPSPSTAGPWCSSTGAS